jgi:hypothetical protein
MSIVSVALWRLKTGACVVKLGARIHLYKIHNLWQLVIERHEEPLPDQLAWVAPGQTKLPS